MASDCYMPPSSCWPNRTPSCNRICIRQQQEIEKLKDNSNR